MTHAWSLSPWSSKLRTKLITTFNLLFRLGMIQFVYFQNFDRSCQGLFLSIFSIIDLNFSQLQESMGGVRQLFNDRRC